MEEDQNEEQRDDRYIYFYENETLKRELSYLYRKKCFEQLELHINSLKDIGVEYQGKWFKCDEEAKNNVTQTTLFIDNLLPITWFTRNGEQGTITITTKEEWYQFVGVLANKMAEIQNKYYSYKYLIENATTVEEIEALNIF